MSDEYSKRKDKKRFSKHFSSEKERHLLGIDEDDELETAFSDVDDLPESFYIRGSIENYDWEDM